MANQDGLSQGSVHRHIVFVLLLSATGSSTYALERGTNYDFICSDGQDILNARLLDEDEKLYTVKLTASVQTILIEKKFVTRVSPVKVVAKSVEPQSRFIIGIYTGVLLNTGRLTEFTGSGAGLGSSLFRVTEHNIRFGVRTEGSMFSRFDSALYLFNAMAAADYRFLRPKGLVEIGPGFAVGFTFIYGKVRDAVVSGAAPAARTWVTAAYPLKENFSAELQVGALYVADQSTMALFPEAFLVATYRL